MGNTIEGVFWLAFLGIGAVVLYVFVSKIIEWNRNNHAPKEAVCAQLVGKEAHTSTSMVPTGTDGSMMVTDNTSYELVFHTTSGEQKKYYVNHSEYKKAVQGASGVLHFQGTRFLAFIPD